MSDQYRQLTHHVAIRDGLPPAIRPTLLEESQKDWQAHQRFSGKAQFFMRVHRQLLDGADDLAEGTEQLLDTPGDVLSDYIRHSAIAQNARRLLHFAHGHHEIEDYGYFPKFIRLYPELEDALALLDADHQVMDETLNSIEFGLQTLLRVRSRDNTATLYQGAAALKKIMHRHITDEEEVIIPIFLRHG